MGKKSTRSKRKTELRVIFFIILVATALFVVSTYAWFSTQKNVSITNLSGTVEVAEGLEISLDALNWSNGIVLGTNAEAGEKDIIKDAYTGHRNLSPTELLPVSTLGKIEDNMLDIQLFRGKITNTIELSDIVEVSHDNKIIDSENMKFAGHFAFDIFLKNSSRMDKEVDELQLNYDSSVTIMANEEGTDKSGTGLQNTVRVAFAKFGGTKDAGGNFTGIADVMASQETILQKTGAGGTNPDDVYITDVAIWEPNAGDHVEYIVTNNNRITWAAADEPNPSQTLANGKKGFTATSKIPTYALKSSAVGATISDVYNWDGNTNKSTLEKQITLQTTRTSATDYTINEGVQYLISTKSANTTESGIEKFVIPANSVSRVRVYVWLEGQDVDCINYASHGGGVTVNIGLVKGSGVGTFEPTEET